MTTTKARLREIDVLRFLAALSVMLYHYTYRGWSEDALSDVAFPELSMFTMYGFMGVNLFFIVSGFVILLSSQGRSPYQFVVSRFTRLYPTYWAAIAFSVLAIATLSDGRFSFTWTEVLANMTMIQRYLGSEHLEGVYWTLLVELKFYFWIFVLMVSGLLHRIRIFLFAWFLVSAIYLLGFHSPLIFHAAIPKWSGYFISGAAFYLAYRDGWARDNVALLVCGGSLVIANLFLLAPSPRFFWIQVGIVSTFYLAFVLIVRRSFSTAFGVGASTLGALTYPLYLIHESFGYMLFNLTDEYLNRWVALCAVSAAALAVALAFNRWIEQPLLPVIREKLQSREQYLPVFLRRKCI